MNRHSRFLGSIGIGTEWAANYSATYTAPVAKTWADVPAEYRNGPVIDLDKVSEATENLFVGAMLYANPNLISLEKLNGAQRVDFFTRMQSHFISNKFPELFATTVNKNEPWKSNGYGGYFLNFSSVNLGNLERMVNDDQIGLISQFGFGIENTAIRLLRKPYKELMALMPLLAGSSVGQLSAGAINIRRMIFDAIGQTVSVYETNKNGIYIFVSGRDNWPDDQAAWSFVSQFGSALGVNFPPVYPHISESGSDNKSRNAMNRQIWRKNVISRGEAILNGIDPQTVIVQDYMPFDEPKKGSEYYAGMIAALATTTFISWGVAGAVGTMIPNNFPWLQNQWQTKIVQPLEKIVTNPLGGLKEAAMKPLETVKQVIADPMGAAGEYTSKKVKEELAPYARYLEIVVDPSGFVRDKITNEILYPLQNPGDWLADQSQKLMRNKLTGEMRDLITGALITTPPVSINADIPLSASQPIAVTQTYAPAKPTAIPWRLVLMGVSLLWGMS